MNVQAKTVHPADRMKTLPEQLKRPTHKQMIALVGFFDGVFFNAGGFGCGEYRKLERMLDSFPFVTSAS